MVKLISELKSALMFVANNLNEIQKFIQLTLDAMNSINEIYIDVNEGVVTLSESSKKIRSTVHATTVLSSELQNRIFDIFHNIQRFTIKEKP